MVRIDQPVEADTVVAQAAAAAAAAVAVATAATARPAPETSVGLDRHSVAFPEELSSNVIHLSCESTAEGGVCDVYLVGTVHRSKVTLHPAGSEFFGAYEEAIKYGGRVILGDRPLERAWRQLPLWSKIKSFFPAVFISSSDDLSEMGMDDSAAAAIFCKEFPTLTEAFVHERDQYMSSKLLEVLSKSTSVVAVVGRSHQQGIKKNWKQPVVLEDLMKVPPPISATSILTSAGLAQAGVYIIWRLYRKCKK